MNLYRPVGIDELALIYDLEFKAFPPRRPEQPIFYPVLNFQYAEQIARDWNTTSSPFAGYITEFEIEDDYVAQFEIKVVGGSNHAELWITAEQLNEFNQHINGKISVVAAYFGNGFTGYVPDRFGLKRKDAAEQLKTLYYTLDCSSFDFYHETLANRKAVYLNYRYWMEMDSSKSELTLNQKERTLDAIRAAWKMGGVDIELV